jgi:hypothetical protein
MCAALNASITVPTVPAPAAAPPPAWRLRRRLCRRCRRRIDVGGSSATPPQPSPHLHNYPSASASQGSPSSFPPPTCETASAGRPGRRVARADGWGRRGLHPNRDSQCCRTVTDCRISNLNANNAMMYRQHIPGILVYTSHRRMTLRSQELQYRSFTLRCRA